MTRDIASRAALRIPVGNEDELVRLEQASVQAGLRWLATARRVAPLTEGFVRRLHLHLLGRVWRHAGRYRTTERSGACPPDRIAEAVASLCDEARGWLAGRQMEPAGFAARFHHRLVRLQCFETGCGRHARILTDVVLRGELGLPPVSWGGNGRLDIEARKTQYEAALAAADLSNYEPLERFMRGDAARGDGAQLSLF